MCEAILLVDLSDGANSSMPVSSSQMFEMVAVVLTCPDAPQNVMAHHTPDGPLHPSLITFIDPMPNLSTDIAWIHLPQTLTTPVFTATSMSYLTQGRVSRCRHWWRHISIWTDPTEDAASDGEA